MSLKNVDMTRGRAQRGIDSQAKPEGQSTQTQAEEEDEACQSSVVLDVCAEGEGVVRKSRAAARGDVTLLQSEPSPPSPRATPANRAED